MRISALALLSLLMLGSASPTLGAGPVTPKPETPATLRCTFSFTEYLFESYLRCHYNCPGYERTITVVNPRICPRIMNF
jgi:hypothetical protein